MQISILRVDSFIRRVSRVRQLALRRQPFQWRAGRRDVHDPANREIERRQSASLLTDTLARIAAGHPINRIAELMPWTFQSPSTDPAI